MDRLSELEDRLIIGFDGHSKDETCLVVAREENSSYRVINKLSNKDAEYIYECLTGVKKIPDDEENKIYKWIYQKYFSNLDKEKLIEKVEEALGFKLFIWQKSFIETGIFRKYGETTARILRDLLAVDSSPLDFSKKATSLRSDLYRKELKEMQQKLNAAGIQTRRVFWNESDKRKYYEKCN